VSHTDTQNIPQVWWRAPLLLFILAMTAVAFWLLASVPLRWDQQAVLGGCCLALAIAIKRLWRSNISTLILSLLSAFSTIRYAYYRVSETYSYLSVNWAEAHVLDLFFVFTLLAAEFYAFIILFLGFFQTIRPLNRRSQPLPQDSAEWPSVDIYVPTYNEPLDVVRTTILAAMNIDWPSDRVNVYVLDDGRRDEFKEFAETCGCHYLIRPDNKHAKAGNINHALGKTNGEYIAIFDCDHIPTRSFLQVTMGWFLKDSRLGMVQTPHHFYSPDPFERNLGIFRRVPNEGSLFYGVIQNGSDYWNGTFFCGSCAVIRRTALEEVGGIAVETVTEDAHTSLRLQRRHWNTAYLRFPQAAGLATGSLAAHIGQRIRWARGMVQILRTDNPLFGKGLRLPQRLCYLNSMLHYLYAIPRLLFLTSPLVYLLLGCSNIYGYSRAILAYAIPHLALAIVANSRVQGRYRYSFWNEVYETVLAPFILLPTTVALISPKHGKFNVTSKSDRVEEEYFDWRMAAPYVVLLTLNCIGIFAGIYRMVIHAASNETLLLNVIWCVMNSIILAAAAAVARESRQRRGTVRIAAKIPVSVITSTGVEIKTQTVDVSRGGFSIPPIKGWSTATGERALAIFESQGERYRIPSIVVDSGDKTARFGFGRLSLEEEEQLTRVIFGRADSWLAWCTEENADRPLLSFLNIIGIALQGLAAIATGVFDTMRRSSPSLADTEDIQVRNPALPSIIAVFLGIMLAAACAPSLRAQAIDISSPSFSDSYDLIALGHQQAVMLKGSDARTTISFGVPVTKVVTQAKLEISYRASAALAPKSSTIDVSLNGTPVSSVPIADTSDPESVESAELELPAELLVADNTITFQLKGKCAPGCLGGTPATLWLKLDRSTRIQLSGSVLAIANNLRLLPAPFFDETSHRPVTAQMAFAETPDPRLLEASGIVASWLGTLADFRGIHFPVTVGSLPRGNVIVFAAKGSSLIPDQSLNALNGPAIGLRDNPSDPYGKVLVVTGDDSQQILAAARALASGRYPRQGDMAELGAAGMPPPRRVYDAPRWLNKNAETLSPEDLRVYGSGSVNLYFRLPPDVSFGSRTVAPLRLNYELARWTSRMRGEMRIKLNGQYVTTRPLSAASGQEKRSTTIGLPVDHLFPTNTLTIEFSVEGSQPAGGRSTPEQAIRRDSSLDLSGLAHYIEMPRLDLFASSGFPFTKFADLSETAVILPHSLSSQQASLYLALLGFFGARTGYPALRVSVLYPEQTAAAGKKHLLVIGGGDEEGTAALKYSGPARVDGAGIRISPRPDMLSFLPWRKSADESRLAADVLIADPPPTGFISEFASPFGKHATVVSFQARNASQYSDLEQLFGENTHLADIQGNLSLLQDGQLHSFILNAKTYSYGNLRWDERWRNWAQQHYWVLPLLLLLAAAILGSQLNAWLEARARLRLESHC
jgi:cellulose synthase (UDP-forming)